jgi:hypothetical protein
MTTAQFQQQLASLQNWKRKQQRILNELLEWLPEQKLRTPEVEEAIKHALAALGHEHLTVAVIGEFSRGKTELINALFFSDLGRRVLPSDAGRTTMCPTEIFQDETIPPCLWLLPIETRQEDTALHDLRADLSRWQKFDLHPEHPELLQQQLRELTASRDASTEEADRLGLEPIESDTIRGIVRIPKWRMALINYRHPLLAQGLRLLDTPGLNAVGNEPELTYEMLPSAQATLFILGADTGVTASDLEIWHRYVRPPSRHGDIGLMIILNKTDTLWDDLRSFPETQASIDRQVEQVSQTLNIMPQQIYPVSARTALVARVKRDHGLEARSGIVRLEQHLSTELVHNRQELLLNDYTRNVCRGLLILEDLVEKRLQRVRQQQRALHTVNQQSDNTIRLLLEKADREKQGYQGSVMAYKKSRDAFHQHGQTLLEALSLNSLNLGIEEAKRRMSGALTTYGLREAMRVLFDDIHRRMETVEENNQQMRQLVRAIYTRFENEHGFRAFEIEMFSVAQHRVTLTQLHEEAEIFRKSPRTALTAQHFLVERYFRTIVQRARQVFVAANNEAKLWMDTALQPLTLQVKEHREQLNQQVQDLRQAHQSRSTIQQRQNMLQVDERLLEGQIGSLRNIRQELTQVDLPNDGDRWRPQLVEQEAG